MQFLKVLDIGYAVRILVVNFAGKSDEKHTLHMQSMFLCKLNEEETHNTQSANACVECGS